MSELKNSDTGFSRTGENERKPIAPENERDPQISNFYRGIQRLAGVADGKELTIRNIDDSITQLQADQITDEFLSQASMASVQGTYRGISFTFHTPLGSVPPRLLIASNDDSLKSALVEALGDVMHTSVPHVADLASPVISADLEELFKVPVPPSKGDLLHQWATKNGKRAK